MPTPSLVATSSSSCFVLVAVLALQPLSLGSLLLIVVLERKKFRYFELFDQSSDPQILVCISLFHHGNKTFFFKRWNSKREKGLERVHEVVEVVVEQIHFDNASHGGVLLLLTKDLMQGRAQPSQCGLQGGVCDEGLW